MFVDLSLGCLHELENGYMSLFTEVHLRFVEGAVSRGGGKIAYAETSPSCDTKAIRECTNKPGKGLGCLNRRAIKGCCVGAQEAIECLRPLYKQCDRKVLNDALANVEKLYSDMCSSSQSTLPTVAPEQRPPTANCDSCSYVKNNKCVTVCPGEKACVKRKAGSFCVNCNCFSKLRGGKVTSCCTLNKRQTGCKKAVRADGEKMHLL